MGMCEKVGTGKAILRLHGGRVKGRKKEKDNRKRDRDK